MKNEESKIFFGILIIIIATIIEIVQWESYPISISSEDIGQQVPEWQYAIYVLSIIFLVFFIVFLIKKLAQPLKIKKNIN